MKKVSIIMPVNNGEKHISESIDSILNQTYKNFELIIINEYNSNLNVTNILKDYEKKDSRIILIQNLKEEGIAESLNIGIRVANGEYIARMDSDDISMPNRIEKQVKFLDENPEIGLCGIEPEYFGDSEYNWKLTKNSKNIKHEIFFNNPCVHSTIMFRKSVIEQYKLCYNKMYYASEDYDFLSKFAIYSKIENIIDKKLFKYRISNNNSTNINNDIENKMYSKIMKELFLKELNLKFSEEEISLLNIRIGLTKYSEKELLNKYIKLDLLLKKILVSSYYTNKYNIDDMFNALRKYFLNIKKSITNVQKGNYSLIIDYYLSISIFNNERLIDEPYNEVNNNPEISVLMPVYNSEDYIIDSVCSILNQSFKNFELLLVVENTTNDNTLNYLRIFNDKRIKILITSEKFGLPKSLNYGIDNSKGKYIARIDADDLSMKDRLKKQYEFMENHHDIDVCGTWQQHFSPNYLWVHKTPFDNDIIKCLLIFNCCLCHSTLMLRKDTLNKYNYRYRTDIRQEDYELWSRMSEKCNFAVLPEILGIYRIHENNITSQDFSKVVDSQNMNVARNLERLKIYDYDKRLLNGYFNEISNNKKLKSEAYLLLDKIYTQNKKLKIYDNKALKYAIKVKKDFINGKPDYTFIYPGQNTNLNSKAIIFLKHVIKKIFYPIYYKFKFRVDRAISLNNDLIKKEIEEKVNDLNNKIDSQTDIILKMTSNINNFSYIPYVKNTKIKIAVIFQIASFWPSYESVHKKLINDERFEYKFYLLNDLSYEPSQIKNTEDFLNNLNIDYEILNDNNLDEFYPHIIIMQTPYDLWHRPKKYFSAMFKMKGYRLIYIPYGIEFSGESDSLLLQFGSDFINNMWKIYTISPEIRDEYCKYSSKNIDNVIATGHPKFDGLYYSKCTTNYNLREKANGRKIVLVKIHFPKFFNVNGVQKLVTPDLNIYIKLVNNIKKFSSKYYFVFMLRPLMFDYMLVDGISTLKKLLINNENMFIFTDEDYREALFASDLFICDRSAVAVEIASFNKPILYLQNKNNNEKYLGNFEKLFNAYNLGYSYEDVEQFLLNYDNKNLYNNNYKKEFNKCVPYFDGKAAERIIDDIVKSLEKENKDKMN